MSLVYCVVNCRSDPIVFKIGFTTNLNQRLRTYRTHNPLVRCLGTIEGTKESEMLLHQIFAIDAISPEWFKLTTFNEQILRRLGFPIDKLFLR